MHQPQKRLKALLGLCLSFLVVSCAGLPTTERVEEPAVQYVTARQDNTLLARYAPVFALADSNASYNRIGTPAVRQSNGNKPEVYIDPQRPTIYAMAQTIKNQDKVYTNLIYRVHFEKTPYTHLTGGRNVGLLVILTLNQAEKPLLVTTVHTCGCYLGLVPTSHLPTTSYPEGWSLAEQEVYGERLPGLVILPQSASGRNKLLFWIRSGTHRVMDLDLLPADHAEALPTLVAAPLKPMSDLRTLPFGDAEISFFETEGPRKGYVRNSHKPFERLLMSWWAMDWHIGEDKDLGPREETGTLFYTSLKIWAREKSDLWNFNEFLHYWGWSLP